MLAHLGCLDAMIWGGDKEVVSEDTGRDCAPRTASLGSGEKQEEPPVPSLHSSGGLYTNLQAPGSALLCWDWVAWAAGAGRAQVSSQDLHSPSLAPSCLAPSSVSQGTDRCPGGAAGPLPSPVLCRQKCSSGPAPPGEAGRDEQAEPWDPSPPNGSTGETVPHLCHQCVLWLRLS